MDDTIGAVSPVIPDAWSDPEYRRIALETATERAQRYAEQHELRLVGEPRIWFITPPDHPLGSMKLAKLDREDGIPAELVYPTGWARLMVEYDFEPADPGPYDLALDTEQGHVIDWL